jgi:hypothetical protein
VVGTFPDGSHPPIVYQVALAANADPKGQAFHGQASDQGGHNTVAAEAMWPIKEPYKQAWLDDLRKAGLPEK